MRSKDKAKKIIKKKLVSLALIIIKPFIIPFLIITLLICLCCYITDIFYIGTNEKYEKDFKSELKYYTANEYTEEEKKGFFESVGEFLAGIFKKKIDSSWPVPGYTYISSHFGKREAPTEGASTTHSGIDIPAPEGTEIIAIMDGKVVGTGWGGAGGYTITIESTDKIYRFSYCHSDPNFIVTVGQEVEKGEVIGKVGPKYVSGPENNTYRDAAGNTTNGATTGCHCHFTLRKDGELVDPEEYLQEALKKEREESNWL